MPTHDRALSEAHRRLGSVLRRVRQSAGLSTREIPRADRPGACFSSGHISLVEQGRTAASPELVDVYGEVGGDRAELRALYAQALQATAAAGRTRRSGGTAATALVPPQHVSSDTHRDLVQQHYVVQAQSAIFSLGPAGEIRELTCAFAIRARNDGVRFFYAGHGYPSDPRPGVLEVDAIAGCEIAAGRESATGVVGTFFELDRTLLTTDADAHNLELRVRVHSLEQAAPFARFHAERGNEHLALTVDFDPALRPELAWWFGVADVIDAEFCDPERQFEARPASCRHDFDDLVPGWCYGFGWQW